MSDRHAKALAQARQRLDDERRWLRAHGGNLSGYLLRYGSVKDAGHYGDGGEAIYAADLAKVQQLEAEVASLGGRPF